MDKREWLLILLGSADGRSFQPVQIQKAVFLLGKELEKHRDLLEGEFFQFIPYDYGPFAKAIYHDAEDLALDGLVSVDRPAGRRWSSFSVTPMGQSRADELAEQLPAGARQYVKQLVKWVMDKRFGALVRSIYERYPEYKAKSVFQS